jgi:hypothetical protein
MSAPLSRRSVARRPVPYDLPPEGTVAESCTQVCLAADLSLGG